VSIPPLFEGLASAVYALQLPLAACNPPFEF